MTDLKLFFFGTPQMTLGGTAVNLPRRKVVALLAYLAVTQQQHNRDLLATLLWPESSQSAARGALRRELHALTTALGSAWFHSGWESLGIDLHQDIWCDIIEFRHLLTKYAQHAHRSEAICTQCKDDLLSAVELYTADFLAGFSLPDADGFAEWQRYEADSLQRALVEALRKLVEWFRHVQEYPTAIAFGRRWLALDMLHEPAHRTLMELYALADEETSALHQYDTCVRLLHEELGVLPGTETTALYDAIRNRRFARPSSDTNGSHSQSGLTVAIGRPSVPTIAPTPLQPLIPLVGRNNEWAALQDTWATALSRGAHCAVITGDAGIGKTRLAEELLAWAQQHQIETAQTRAYAAQGELAYTPVVELLRTTPLQRRMSTLDDGWLVHLSRLWPALRETYPHLPQPETVMDSWQRRQLFAALAECCCAEARPMLLHFDDLQWADRETLEWLSYLITTVRQRVAQQGMSPCLLLVGTLRTGEVNAGHPVYRLLQGLQRDDCLTLIDLLPLERHALCELVLQLATSPPDAALFDRIEHQTAGNPLFIVESIRTGIGKTTAEQTMSMADTAQWSTVPMIPLPPKAYGVIHTRLLQLSSQAQELVAYAAVIGRAFSFELLSAITKWPDETLATAIDELWVRRIIRERGVGGYDFTHDRIRDVAYNEIGPARRRLLHRQCVDALEALDGDRIDQISGELAAHCVQAGLVKRALGYYQHAASTAQRIGAYTEAIALMQRGLTLLPKLPETLERKAQELALLLQLGTLQRTAFGYAAEVHGQTLQRARVLCHELNKQESLHHVLMGLYTHHFGRGAIRQSQTIAKELLQVAQLSRDSMALEEAYHAMGSHLFALGEFQAAHDYFQQGIAVYDPQRHEQHIADFGYNLGCFTRAFDTHALWMLGVEEDALRQLSAAIDHARTLGHPFTLALVLAYGAMLQQFRRRPHAVEALAAEALALCHKHGIAYYEVWCTLLHTWAVAVQAGDSQKLALMSATIARFRDTDSGIRLPYYLYLLADLYLQLGQFELSLTTLAEAEAVAASHGEAWWLVAIHRLQGEIGHRQGHYFTSSFENVK